MDAHNLLFRSTFERKIPPIIRSFFLTYLGQDGKDPSGLPVGVDGLHQFGVVRPQSRGRFDVQPVERVGDVVAKEGASRIHARYAIQLLRSSYGSGIFSSRSHLT